MDRWDMAAAPVAGHGWVSHHGRKSKVNEPVAAAEHMAVRETGRTSPVGGVLWILVDGVIGRWSYIVAGVLAEGGGGGRAIIGGVSEHFNNMSPGFDDRGNCDG